MAPSFEQPNKTSSENLENKTNSQEAMETAEKSVEELVSQINQVAKERLADNPTVHFKGRDWQLSELPDEYEDIAYIQKELNLIEETLEEIVEENQNTDPGTAKEATSYFKIQLLSRTQGFLESQSEFEAEKLGLKLQHPDIYNALNR